MVNETRRDIPVTTPADRRGLPAWFTGGIRPGAALLCLLLSLTAGASPPVREVVIPFHFRERVVTVDDSVPTGTVLGVTPLTVQTSTSCPGYPPGGGLQDPDGSPWPAVMIDTDIPGLGARVVEDDAGATTAMLVALSLELIKTGPVSDGVIRDISGLPEFCLCRATPAGGGTWVREAFHLQRPLYIRRLPLTVDPVTGLGRGGRAS